MKNGKFGITGLRAAMSAFVFFICLVTNMLACTGCFITHKRNVNPLCIVGYGTCLFFLGFIPLVTQGDILMKFGRIPEQGLQTMCNLSPQELKKEDPFTYEIFHMAHRFDDISELMLDRYMCTDTCPCMLYNDQMLNGAVNE